MKTCPRCKTPKDSEAFYHYKGKPFGYCKPCAKEYQDEYKSKQREHTPEELAYAKEYAQKMKDKHGEFVYLVSSPTFEGYVKIGRTTQPDKRLIGYNTHTPFKDFHFLRVYKVDKSYEAEADLLEIMAHVCPSQGEWFHIDRQKIIDLSDSIIKTLGGKVYEQSSTSRA